MPQIYTYSDELTHYGRLGMKWGQHIYGREPSSGIKRPKRKSWKEKRADKKKAAEKRATEIEAERVAARRKSILSGPAALNKHRDEFTTEEIRKAIERFSVEKDLARVANETHSERMKTANRGKDYVDTVVGYTTSSIKMYNNFAHIRNAIAGPEQPQWRIIGVKTEQKKQT